MQPDTFWQDNATEYKLSEYQELAQMKPGSELPLRVGAKYNYDREIYG